MGACYGKDTVASADTDTNTYNKFMEVRLSLIKEIHQLSDDSSGHYLWLVLDCMRTYQVHRVDNTLNVTLDNYLTKLPVDELVLLRDRVYSRCRGTNSILPTNEIDLKCAESHSVKPVDDSISSSSNLSSFADSLIGNIGTPISFK